MTSKFKFLLKDSLRKKTTTKSFKIINIILCLIIVVLVNLDGIIKLFGGDFNEVVKIYVVDEVNAYDAFKYTMDNTFLDTLGSYNAEIVKSEEDVKNKLVIANIYGDKDMLNKNLIYFNNTYKKIANRGGNNNGIGMEVCINEGADIYLNWQLSAKISDYLVSSQYGLQI